MANTRPILHNSTLSIQIPKDLHDAYREVVFADGRTIAGSIRKHMREHVDAVSSSSGPSSLATFLDKP